LTLKEDFCHSNNRNKIKIDISNGNFPKLNLDCPEELHNFNVNMIQQTKNCLSYKFENEDTEGNKIII